MCTCNSTHVHPVVACGHRQRKAHERHGSVHKSSSTRVRVTFLSHALSLKKESPKTTPLGSGGLRTHKPRLAEVHARCPLLGCHEKKGRARRHGRRSGARHDDERGSACLRARPLIQGWRTFVRDYRYVRLRPDNPPLSGAFPIVEQRTRLSPAHGDDEFGHAGKHSSEGTRGCSEGSNASRRADYTAIEAWPPL